MENVLNILTDKFLEVLDSDVTHLEMSITALDQLKASVLKRDETKLKKLLALIQTELDAYSSIENQRAVLRNELAKIIGCPAQDLNISKLSENVKEPRKELLLQKKAQLRHLVNRLKNEHSSTALFLQECARMNSRLLRAIMGKQKELTYNRFGKSDWNDSPRSARMLSVKY